MTEQEQLPLEDNAPAAEVQQKVSVTQQMINGGKAVVRAARKKSKDLALPVKAEDAAPLGYGD